MPLFDAYALPGTPWKNGGGVTRTLLASPPGAGFENFDWRVSIADVAASGEFSRFPGVDRTIVLLSGAGMVLRIDYTEVRTLNVPFEPYAFSGDSHVDSRLLDGPARDFNLMTRRGRVHATLKVWNSEFCVTGSDNAALFFSARGTYRIEGVAVEEGWVFHADKVPSDIQCTPETPCAVIIAVQVNQTENRGEDS
jgi:environmental stress-induced protein Ves